MTLLFAESFEGYITGGNRTVLDPVYGFASPYVGTTNAGVLGTGRVSGKCGFLDVGYTQGFLAYGFELDATALSSSSTWIIGFAFKVDENHFATTGPSRLPLLQFLDSDRDEMTTLYVAAGNVNVVTGGVLSTAKIDFGTVALFTRVWHYVEMRITFDTSSSGAVEVRVDGETVLSGTGVTAPTLTLEEFPTTLIFGSSNFGLRVLVDDLYVCDSAGSVNNSFLGDIGIRRLDPDGDGTTNDFTPLGGGANYVEVDEDDPDADTTYVESSTLTDKDLYTMDDAASTPTAINALQVVVTNKSGDGGAKSGRNRLRSNVTEVVGSDYSLESTYVPEQSIHETDPNTGSAWTEAGVNAAEVGMEVTA